MVLVMLLLSLGWVFVVWLLATMAECGLTIGMLISFPFVWLYEKIKDALDPRTEEQKKEDALREFEEYKKEHYNEKFHVWIHW